FVLDRSYFSSDAVLPAFEVDLAVFLFMSAADVARSEPAVVVPAAAPFLYLDETLVRLRFRDLSESRKRLETERGSEWAKTFESHNQLDEIDLVAFLQCHDRLFPMRFTAEISAAFALLFP